MTGWLFGIGGISCGSSSPPDWHDADVAMVIAGMAMTLSVCVIWAFG